MKILYISDNNIYTTGGSQTSILLTVKLMKNQENKIGVIMPSIDQKNKIYEDNDIKYFEYRDFKGKSILKYGYLFFIKSYLLKKYIKKFNPDIIHVQNPSSILCLCLLKKYKLINKKIKLVYTDRGFFTGYSKRYQKFMIKNSKYIDNLVCTTDLNQQEWKKYTSMEAKVVPNALEDYWFDYDKNREISIKEQNKAKEKIVIGFAGRYVEYKRWDTVLNIINKLSNDDRYLFVIAITSDKKNDLELNNYIKKIKKMSNIIIYQDADYDKMVEFYYLTDIYVITSEKESFGKTIIEAMSKYNIVFGTNSGGIPYIIQNKDYLFEVNDVDAVVNKVKNIELVNMNEIKKLNYKYICDNFSSEILKSKLNELYRK